MTTPRSRRPVAGVALALAALAGCAKPPELQPPEPPTVTVVHPGERDSAPYKEFTGRVEAKDPVRVVPQVTGVLLSRDFVEGKLVKKDETELYHIDPVLFRADLDSAAASLAKAEADIVKAKADAKDAAAREKAAKAILDEARGDEREFRIGGAPVLRLAAKSRTTVSGSRLQAENPALFDRLKSVTNYDEWQII